MPAFYAHDRFGKEVLTHLRGELKEVCVRHFNEFALGFQGPDYLFFYKPLSKNSVNQLGYQMHGIHCNKILEENMIPVIQMRGLKSSAYAYVLGFICHFILDSECHPYVNEMVEVLHMGHLDIEGEFEKYLLMKDNKRPEEYRMDKLIAKSLDSDAIQCLYPSLSITNVEAAIRDFRKYKKFLTAPSFMKRGLITAGLKVSGSYHSLKGVMLTPKINKVCELSNKELYKRYEHAVEVAVEILNDFHESMTNDKSLHERFDRDFES